GRQREAEQALLRRQRQQGHSQRRRMQGRQLRKALQAQARAPQEADADTRQDQAEQQGGGGLHATVAVGGVGGRGVGAAPAGEQGQQVGDQVRQGVGGVGDEAEGAGEQADDDLADGEQGVGGHRDEGRALDAACAHDLVGGALERLAGQGGDGGGLHLEAWRSDALYFVV